MGRVPHPFAFCAKGWAVRKGIPVLRRDRFMIPTLANRARVDAWVKNVK